MTDLTKVNMRGGDTMIWLNLLDDFKEMELTQQDIIDFPQVPYDLHE